MIDIVRLRNTKKKYPTYNDNQFLSLNEYLKITEKIIQKLAPTIQYGLDRVILSNDDTISFIAYAIMLADWLWQQKPKNMKVRSLYSYRNQMAIWAIYDYISRSSRTTTKKIKYQNLDLYLKVLPIQNNNTNSDLLEYLNDVMDNAVKNNIISKRNIQFIKLYYLEGMTLQQIASLYNVYHQLVRNNIQKNIHKLKDLMKDYD